MLDAQLQEVYTMCLGIMTIRLKSSRLQSNRLQSISLLIKSSTELTRLQLLTTHFFAQQLMSSKSIAGGPGGLPLVQDLIT